MTSRCLGCLVLLCIICTGASTAHAVETRWSFDAGSPIVSSPSVNLEGVVYLAAASGLYAVTNGGSNLWFFPMGPFASSPAIGSDGTIYVASGTSPNGKLYAIRPDGSAKWTNQIQWDASFPYGSSPALGFADVVYIRGAYGSLIAVSPAGTNLWSRPVGGTQSAAIGPDGTIYTGSAALAPDGAQKWSAPTTPIGDSPALGADAVIYVTGGWEDGRSLYAISSQGAFFWTNVANLFIRSSAAVGQEQSIYVPTYGGGTLCAIASSGILKWTATLAANNPTNAPAPATPAIDSVGTIYYPVFNTLYALSADGQIRWTFSPGDGSLTAGSPAIAPDGTIYVAFGSKLYALYGTNRLADAPWPMYRQNPRHTGKVEKPSLQQPKKRADAHFEFELFGQIDQAFTIESSTNLRDWIAFTNLLATNVPMGIVDPSPGNQLPRFYRAIARGH